MAKSTNVGLDWVKSYLLHRKHCVRVINSNLNKWIHVNRLPLSTYKTSYMIIYNNRIAEKAILLTNSSLSKRSPYFLLYLFAYYKSRIKYKF